MKIYSTARLELADNRRSSFHKDQELALKSGLPEGPKEDLVGTTAYKGG
jgi:hypothetical protein